MMGDVHNSPIDLVIVTHSGVHSGGLFAYLGYI
jgi:hypothetical protein